MVGSSARTGSGIRTGPLRAARTVLALGDTADERERALRQVAVGHLLRQDGLRGLSHPTDSRLVRPGLGGTVVGVVVAVVFLGITLAMTGIVGALGDAGAEDVSSSGPGGDPFADPFGGPAPADGDWTMGWPDDGAADGGGSGVVDWVATGVVVLGALLLLAALLALAVRLASVVRGTLLVRRGRATLAGLPGATGVPDVAAEHAALDAAYPRFAGMLSWSRPRTRTLGRSSRFHGHDRLGHDPFDHHDPHDHHDDPHDHHDDPHDHHD